MVIGDFDCVGFVFLFFALLVIGYWVVCVTVFASMFENVVELFLECHWNASRGLCCISWSFLNAKQLQKTALRKIT